MSALRQKHETQVTKLWHERWKRSPRHPRTMIYEPRLPFNMFLDVTKDLKRISIAFSSSYAQDTSHSEETCTEKSAKRIT